MAPRRLYRLLKGEDARRAEEHLESCPTCRAGFLPLEQRLCREILDVLDDYLERRLSERDLRSLEAHLAVCPDCINYLESYKSAVKLGRESHRREPAPPLPEDLVKAVLAARRKS